MASLKGEKIKKKSMCITLNLVIKLYITVFKYYTVLTQVNNQFKTL